MFKCINLNFDIDQFFNSCDDVFLDGRRCGPDDAAALSMSTADKIRSALTKIYSFEGQRGHIGWDRETSQGNPSLSFIVQNYFKSLNRRKVIIIFQVIVIKIVLI